MRALIWFGVAVLLLIGIVLALPFLIDLNHYKDQYKPAIEHALNRNIQLQDIQLTVWPRLGARVAGLTVLDDPAFGPESFASLSSLEVGIHFWPLLSGQIEIEAIILKNPVITVVKNQKGVLNVATLGRPGLAAPETPSRAPVPSPEGPLKLLGLLAVDRFSIEGGTLTYHDLSSGIPTDYVIEDLGAVLTSVRLGQSPNVHLEMRLHPFNLPITVDGQMGPMTESLELERFNFTCGRGQTTIEIKGSFLRGLLDATVSSASVNTADIPMTLPLTKPVKITNLLLAAHIAYPLKAGVPLLGLVHISELRLGILLGQSVITVTGSVVGGQAHLSASSPLIYTAELPIKGPLAQPVELQDLKLAAEITGQDARLTSLSFSVFNGSIKVQAAMGLHAVGPPFSSTVTLQEVHLGPALDAFGSTGPSISGTANANISMNGLGLSMPELSRALEGTGRFHVKDGRIEGVNVIQEAVTLLKVTGISFDNPKTTAFSTIETDLAIQQGVIHVQRLFVDSHDFQATGGGVVGFDQRLNMTLLLTLSQALSQKLVAALPVSNQTMRAGRVRLPLAITGTVQSPSYGLDMKGLSEND